MGSNRSLDDSAVMRLEQVHELLLSELDLKLC